MPYYAQLLRATLAAFLMPLAVAGAAFAGPLEDGVAAVERQDYAAALRLFRPLANQGNDIAQFDLGVMYDKGWGVPRDHVQAARWYRLAAAQGNADAQYNLGVLYEDGRRYADAVKWYREAADQGLGDAQFSLGLLYAKGQGTAAGRCPGIHVVRIIGSAGRSIRSKQSRCRRSTHEARADRRGAEAGA